MYSIQSTGAFCLHLNSGGGSAKTAKFAASSSRIHGKLFASKYLTESRLSFPPDSVPANSGRRSEAHHGQTAQNVDRGRLCENANPQLSTDCADPATIGSAPTVLHGFDQLKENSFECRPQLTNHSNQPSAAQSKSKPGDGTECVPRK